MHNRYVVRVVSFGHIITFLWTLSAHTQLKILEQRRYSDKVRYALNKKCPQRDLLFIKHEFSHLTIETL
jgi:hypothetical protein